mmetsp:Transcript_23597/g.67780  ORF Transcript_23597/g.67780 Transcript_23597/m.67780 type:complete len:383 (-) Transcript_23597:1684-2832(-)
MGGQHEECRDTFVHPADGAVAVVEVVNELPKRPDLAIRVRHGQHIVPKAASPHNIRGQERLCFWCQADRIFALSGVADVALEQPQEDPCRRNALPSLARLSRLCVQVVQEILDGPQPAAEGPAKLFLDRRAVGHLGAGSAQIARWPNTVVSIDVHPPLPVGNSLSPHGVAVESHLDDTNGGWRIGTGRHHLGLPQDIGRISVARVSMIEVHEQARSPSNPAHLAFVGSIADDLSRLGDVLDQRHSQLLHGAIAQARDPEPLQIRRGRQHMAGEDQKAIRLTEPVGLEICCDYRLGRSFDIRGLLLQQLIQLIDHQNTGPVAKPLQDDFLGDADGPDPHTEVDNLLAELFPHCLNCLVLGRRPPDPQENRLDECPATALFWVK